MKTIKYILIAIFFEVLASVLTQIKPDAGTPNIVVQLYELIIMILICIGALTAITATHHLRKSGDDKW